MLARGLTFLTTLLLGLAIAPSAWADPPTLAGRVAELSGVVWLYDADNREWTALTRNQTVSQGDRLHTDANGRVTVRLGSTNVWLDGRSDVLIAQMDEGRVVLQLDEGRIGPPEIDGLIALTASEMSRAVVCEKSMKSDVNVTALGGCELTYDATEPPIIPENVPPKKLAVNRLVPVCPLKVVGAAAVKFNMPDVAGAIPKPPATIPAAVEARKLKVAATSNTLFVPLASRKRNVTGEPGVLVTVPVPPAPAVKLKLDELLTGEKVANVVIADAGTTAMTATAPAVARRYLFM